jgi:hypothetical protein
MNPHAISRLAKLSMFRAGRDVPQVPSNQDRLALFRASQPPQIGNAHKWKWVGMPQLVSLPQLARDIRRTWP